MITVALADDHRLVREGLRRLLEAEPDLQVVGEAESGRAALQLAMEVAPDVLILDISMPGLNGIDACRQITGQSATRVVALSMHRDHAFVAAMVQAGAMAYVVKDTAPEELVGAVRAAAAGRRLTSPEALPAAPGEAPAGPLPEVLSRRQREVLQLVAEGHTSLQIAATLDVGVRTVETYRRQIMDKLGYDNVADLTKYAIRHGLTDLAG